MPEQQGMWGKVGNWFNQFNQPGGGTDLLGNPMFRMGMGLLQSRYDRNINPYGAALEGFASAQQYKTQREEEEEQKRLREARKKAGEQIRDLLAPQQIPGGQELEGPLLPGVQGPLQSQAFQQQSPMSAQLGPFSDIVGSISEADPIKAAQLAQTRLASPTNPINIEAQLSRTGFWEPESIHKAANAPGGYDASLLVKINKMNTKETERLGAANDAAQKAVIDIGKINYMQERFMALGSDLQEGWAGKGRAFMRNATGTQEELDDVQRMFAGLRSSTAMANLPPGSASDKDVDLALAPIPDEFADREHLYRFMEGAKKLAVIEQAYNQAKAQYMHQNFGEGGFIQWWQANGDAKIQRAWQMHGMSLNTLGEGVYANMFPGLGTDAGGGGGSDDALSDEQQIILDDLLNPTNRNPARGGRVRKNQ